eukprot:m.1639084 g.1639084  ORF g.1639084 m.1639084 type:complete len:306 (-) comp32982_c0_seq1:213-1130(-)
MYPAVILSTLPDWLALYLKIPSPCNTARILQWTSWTWILIRGSYFRVDRIEGGNQKELIQAEKSALKRALFKSLLLVACMISTIFDFWLSVIAGNDPDILFDETNTTVSPRVKESLKTTFKNWYGDFPSLSGYNVAVLACLAIHLIFWECVEEHLINEISTNTKICSISRYIANGKNQKFKNYCLLPYCVVLILFLFTLNGIWSSVAFSVGMILLLFVKTESHKGNDKDDFQTDAHCTGMIIVLGVAITLTTHRQDMLWIVQFSSILPYFYRFLTSLSSHHLIKIRSEVKMFKHLGDLIVSLLIV